MNVGTIYSDPSTLGIFGRRANPDQGWSPSVRETLPSGYGTMGRQMPLAYGDTSPQQYYVREGQERLNAHGITWRPNADWYEPYLKPNAIIQLLGDVKDYLERQSIPVPEQPEFTRQGYPTRGNEGYSWLLEYLITCLAAAGISLPAKTNLENFVRHLAGGA
jgi:hypothetical protein